LVALLVRLVPVAVHLERELVEELHRITVESDELRHLAAYPNRACARPRLGGRALASVNVGSHRRAVVAGTPRFSSVEATSDVTSLTTFFVLSASVVWLRADHTS